MLHKEIPFLRLGLPLCAGIVSGLYFSPGNLFFITSSVIIILFFCSSLWFNKSLINIVYGLSLTIALFILGLLLYTKEKENISSLEPVKTLFAGELSDFPEEKENTFRMIFRSYSRIDKGNRTAISGSLVLYHKKGPEVALFLPGDHMLIQCTPVEITSRRNPCEFDYRFYMENQGIRYYAFTDSSDIIRHIIPEHRKLTHTALIIREKIIDMFRERGIRGERLALVAAITLGQKNMLDPEQKQHFIKAGVMHIMAVSGLHAVILSLFVFKLLFFLKGRLNVVRVFITILILWAFAFVTGLTPSVLRATLMFSFLQAGNIMRRPVNGINSVLASAFFLILFRPSVIFDSGFLLSYSAVIYIICFYRDLYLKLQFRHKIPDLIWQSAAVTIIAQAGTLPLTIMLFNRFPTWFILSNVIIVPLSSLVVITGCIFPMIFPVQFLSQFLARILDFLAGLTELLTEKASSLPLSSIENIGITRIECALLTITIFLFTRYLLTRKSISVLFPAGALLTFILATTVREISIRRTNELIVYNSIGSSTVGIRTGRILNIFSDTSLAIQEVDRHRAVLTLKERRYPTSGRICQVRAGEEKILITNSLTSAILKKKEPDYVILTGVRPSVEKVIRLNGSLKQLIVGSEASPGFRLPATSGISKKVYFVRKEGAYRKKL